MTPLADEVLLETLAALVAYPTKREAADAMGLSHKTFYTRVKQAKARNLDKHITGLSVPEGMQISHEGYQISPEGEVKGLTARLGAEKGTVDTSNLRHKTVQMDGQGNVERMWLQPGAQDPTLIAEAIKKAFEGFKPKSPTIIAPKNTQSSRLTTYIVTDWHIGMYAWGAETEAPNWDVSIAETAITSALYELIEQTPKSDAALILGIMDCRDSARTAPLASYVPLYQDCEVVDIWVPSGGSTGYLEAEC